MRRFFLIVLLALCGLIVVLLGTAAWLLNDEAFLKKQAVQYTRQFTGRELVISGPLSLELGRETTLEARGITLANPPWAEAPHMVEVGHVRVTLEVSSLFGDLVYLPDLLLEDCSLALLENDSGERNWDFPGARDKPEKEKDAGLLPVALREVTIDRCRLVYDEPGRAQELEVRVASATLQRALHDRIEGRDLLEIYRSQRTEFYFGLHLEYNLKAVLHF